jgi:hypothetical protein
LAGPPRPALRKPIRVFVIQIGVERLQVSI